MSEVKIPFLGMRIRNDKTGYFKMLQQSFIPNFNLVSFSSLLIILNIVLFIIPRIISPPANYSQFLVLPNTFDKWLLDVELIKGNKKYLYEIITSIFLHLSYLHLVGNMVFSLFIMYQMEYCWKPSLLLGFMGGLGANCLAVVVGQGRYLGFSGVLFSLFGVYVSILIINCKYIQANYPGQLPMMGILIVMVLLSMIGDGKSAVIHFLSFILGGIYGAAFFPKTTSSLLSGIGEKIMIGVGIVTFITVTILAIII